MSVAFRMWCLWCSSADACCCRLLLFFFFFEMASASSSSAKLLYGDSKARINQRVRYTIDGIGSLSRNLVRSSKSSETLMQAAKVTSQQEHTIESADLVYVLVMPYFFNFIFSLLEFIFEEPKKNASPPNPSWLPARVHWEQCQSICWCQRTIPRTTRLI